MGSAAIPEDEADRLVALRRTGVLDTSAEETFDEVARLAARLCGTPIALVSLVDEDRQWFKAAIGLNVSETPREVAFCSHAILGSDVMVVPDARQDGRFADNPLVTGPPSVVFYAGFPLASADGHGLGTLCVIDHEPRTLDAGQLETLRVLGRQVAAQLELRTRAGKLAAITAEYEGFFSRSLDLMCVVNTEGYFTRLNPSWETVLGFTLDELKSRALIEFIHPDDRAPTEVALRDLAGGGTVVSFENRYRTKRGSYRWLRWSGTQSDDHALIYGSARDVTDERELEAALRENEARLAAVFAAAVDGIVTIDERGVMLSINPAVTRLFGYAEAELLGANVSMLMPEPYRGEHDGYLAHFRDTGDAQIIGKGRDLVAQRKDGSTFPIYLAVGELVGGRRREFAGVVRDISERVRATALLEGQTRALAVASERAQAANRLKGEFLANMSHELRTPLNGILGFTKLLHDGEVGPVNEQQVEFLGLVLTSSNHLLRLINDVLDLSKVEAGKLEFHPTDIDLEQVVSEICGVVRELAAKKRQRVDVDIEPEVRYLHLDPSRLKQVLYNYLSNAIKFTGAEGTITVRARAEGRDRICLEVEDTGIGIAEEDLGDLFSEFHQLERGPEQQQRGTGLGLAVTKRLVEAQDGEVGVRSVQGVGTVFSAILPRRVATSTASADEHRAESEPGLRHAPRVLVVEDDPRDRAWLRRTLGETGYEVDAVATGREAIAHAERHRYDAVTLDMFLPDMTGLAVLSELRNSALNSQVPAIMVTVVADKGVATGHQIQDFLTKPARSEDLIGALERAGVDASNLPILIVDDDPAAVALASSSLEARGHQVITAANGAAGLLKARMGPLAAVVLDLMMPVLDGFGFLEGFRQLPDADRIPVVVWSSREISVEERRRLQADAQAIVLKGAGATRSLIEAVDQHVGKSR